MLPTELLCDIASFLARHDIDVLKLVNAALKGLVVARFADYPLRPLKLTADANAIRVEEQPVEAGRSIEVSLIGRFPEHVSPILQRYIQRSFVSHLTLEETIQHKAVYVLRPFKDKLRDAICVMPLDVEGGACEHALNELLFCKEIHFGGSEPLVRDDAFGWLHSGAERVFTSAREYPGRVKLIVEQLQNQFADATTATSFLLNLTYKPRRDELPLAACLRDNSGTGERLEIAVSAVGPKVNVVVRRFLAL
ncbi:hypothetical protein AAVH_32476 [Aphelenchoides avenae]|nr:hypothetical protein AAVH_32476 [Aphelenchus avenae]